MMASSWKQKSEIKIMRFSGSCNDYTSGQLPIKERALREAVNRIDEQKT